MRIILVEDEDAHVELVRRAFGTSMPKCRLKVAHNLCDARQLLTELQPHLVIADLVLPDGRGVELIPDKSMAADYPLILMTSHGDEKMAVEAIKLGALDYVVKSDATLADMPHVAERAIREWQNVVQRIRVEEALKESQQRLELALWGTELGLWDWNLQTGEVVSNDRSCEMLGYRIDEVCPTMDAWQQLIHPADLAEVRQCLQDHLAGHSSLYESQHRMRARDGAWMWVLERGKVVERDAGQQPLRATGTRSDVTKAKQAEDERLKLETRVQQAQKLESLGILAGGIAHDFNNLLLGILGHASLALMDLAPGTPARDNVGEIEIAAERAAELCKQLLAYSGRSRFVVETVDLNRVVSEMLSLLETVIAKEAVLQLELSPTPLPIEGAPAQIRQVVMNLITNASDALEGRQGVIRVRTYTSSLDQEYLAKTYLNDNLPAGPYSILEVQDTGRGMEAETMSRMFDPFFTTKSAGHGLGMAAVLGIVRGHHGAIEVQSELNRGTVFRVLFPASNMTAPPAIRRSSVAQPAGPPATVLVIDDEDAVRNVARLALERNGLRVLTARDGLEGISVFEKCRGEIDAILLDVAMPHIDGKETYRRLLKLGIDVPVVLTSGYDESDASDEFPGQSFAGFIQKPYRAESLVSKMRAVLQG